MPKWQIAAPTTCALQRTSPPTQDDEELQRCKIYRKSFPMTEIALPATALRNRAIAKWVRDHRVTVDVRTGEELATAMAAGVQLQRLTLYADALSESELRAAVNLGVGRVVAASVQQIELTAIHCREAGAGCRHPDDRRQHAGPGHRRMSLIGFQSGFRFDSN